jgi:acetylornithine deacetylase/succinyl-diaminopimelate desuccinylase-like protein
MTWHRPNGFTTKIIVTGLGDGSFVNRVCIVDDSGNRSVDKAHRLGPDVDPDAVWAEVETIVRAINEAPMGWQPRDPMLTTYSDFLALDADVDAAEADAKAAGLLAPTWVQ